MLLKYIDVSLYIFFYGSAHRKCRDDFSKLTMQLISFKPEILERIVPDISLERHLKVGIRSNQRKFDEFKNIEQLSTNSNNTLTTSYVKNGNTLVVCNITYGINEFNQSTDKFTSVYPTVNISRGRSGAPTDEEMNLSQKLYESILLSKILPLESLVFKPKVIIDDNLEELDTNKTFKFNLFVNIKILDRSGPLFDICHFTLLSGLKNVKLPTIYLNDNFNKLKVDNLLVHPTAAVQQLSLNLDSDLISSNFGVYTLDSKNIVICDIENESEEVNVITKANVISDGENFKEFSLINAGLLGITKDEIKYILSMSRQRAKNLSIN